VSIAPSNVNVGILAAGIYPNLASLRAATPPLVQRYVRVFGVPGMFYYLPGATLADDGWTVLVPNAGGGAYLQERIVDQGPNLTAAPAQTLGIYAGRWQVLPAGLPLTANVVLTLDPTLAVAGDRKEITRLDATIYTVTIVDGGPGGAALSVLPASSKAWGLFWFNGTNYVERRASVMP
jgi:hypothetical protein